MERLSYFVHHPQISAERSYEPMVHYVLQAFAGESVLLTLDTSMLWDQFCLVKVCFVWGGRSFTLAQVVLEHGSAMVGFEPYQPALQTFALYGQRFGGIVREASLEEKPHFKDYKSAAFKVLHSGLRDAQALTC